MVKRKEEFSLRDSKYSIVFAVILIAAAIWVRAYPLILPIVLISWAYIRTDTFVHLAEWAENHTPFSRTILSWGIAALFTVAIVAYVLIFIVVMAIYTTPDTSGDDGDDGRRLCVVNKLKYGVACNADKADEYYRTHKIGAIRRGDHAIVETPDGTIIQTIVAKPGDTVSVVDAALYVNSEPCDHKTRQVATFCMRPHVPYSDLRKMREANSELGGRGKIKEYPLGVTFRDGHVDHADTSAMRLPVERRIEDWKIWTYAPMQPNLYDERCYPHNGAYLWNAYQWGPMRLPAKGDQIELTYANVKLYGPMIEAYEGAKLKPTRGATYTFRLSYYMTLSDDRDILNDGRTYGPTPESKIIANVIIL